MRSNPSPTGGNHVAIAMRGGTRGGRRGKCTHHAIAQQALDMGNDCLLVVEENDPTLHTAIATLFGQS